MFEMIFLERKQLQKVSSIFPSTLSLLSGTKPGRKCVLSQYTRNWRDSCISEITNSKRAGFFGQGGNRRKNKTSFEGWKTSPAFKFCLCITYLCIHLLCILDYPDLFGILYADYPAAPFLRWLQPPRLVGKGWDSQSIKLQNNEKVRPA